LQHGWRSDADRAALGLCRDALRSHAIEFADALAADAGALLDLHSAAQWPQWLPAFVTRFLAQGERWHSIPMGVHRPNAAWVNAACARRIGGAPPRDMPALLAWLEQARDVVHAPLAVGGDLWQIGVLFESLVLALAGAADTAVSSSSMTRPSRMNPMPWPPSLR
jgi:hypothetical protein